jgi:fatty acid desaturase
MKKSRSYYQNSKELRRELGHALPTEELRLLHRKDPLRHFAVVARQFLLLALCGLGLWRLTQPLLWLPLAVLMGFTMFNFTVLLHEEVHDAIFAGQRPRASRLLSLLYAFPSGISASQFTRWHLDHHDNLGSSTEDPKRFHLSPKRVARWYKLLYCTVALFFIYFRAARREMQGYEPQLQRRIALERNATIALHLGFAALLWWAGGFGVAARVYFVPYFVVFPVAFTLNRLGQHYFIDPTDPAKWSTRVDGNAPWQFLFLYSNFHLEHHYFPSVPFYNLPRLNRLLRPFYEERGIRNHGYLEIAYRWFVLNKFPHTDWTAPSPAGTPVAAV